MRGRFKPKKTEGNRDETSRNTAGLSPLVGQSAAAAAGPDSPVPGVTMVGLGGRKKKGPKYSNCDGERRYLGVRVKMPVKDMLRSIRLAQGWDPQDIQESNGKRSKAGKKRVYTCAERRISRRKPPTKSLEELAIIVEVLEEDLKTGNTCSSLPRLFSPSTLPLSPECSPEPDNRWGPEPHVYSGSLESEPERQMSRTTEPGSLSSPSDEYNNSSYYHHLQSISPHQGAGYNSDESDEMIPSPQYYMSYSPGTAKYPHTFSPPHSVCTSLQPSSFDLYQHRNTGRDGGRAATQEEWVCPQNQSWNLNSATFFWTQLQREESQLRDVSDSVLLATDAQGRTVLHKVVCLGRRALGYAIAKRMAAVNSLDIKDSQGMTALHLAAKQNQHLIVADLIHLGANINERDRSGKTCLHLSAENGYIRVLEVLKHMMKDGIYLDVEATDKYDSEMAVVFGTFFYHKDLRVKRLRRRLRAAHGMSVLQCTSLALTATVRELEKSTCPSESRLHTLRKEQLMETLECLLQMSSYLQTTSCCYGENAFDVSYKKESDQFMQELVSKSNLKKGELCNVGLCLSAQQGLSYWRPDSNVSELIQA